MAVFQPCDKAELTTQGTKQGANCPKINIAPPSSRRLLGGGETGELGESLNCWGVVKSQDFATVP